MKHRGKGLILLLGRGSQRVAGVSSPVARHEGGFQPVTEGLDCRGGGGGLVWVSGVKGCYAHAPDQELDLHCHKTSHASCCGDQAKFRGSNVCKTGRLHRTADLIHFVVVLSDQRPHKTSNIPEREDRVAAEPLQLLVDLIHLHRIHTLWTPCHVPLRHEQPAFHKAQR